MRIRILGFVLAVLASAACGTRPPHPQPPQPPQPPGPVCEEGQTTCCWHMPPGNQWLYACKAPNLPGGVLNVAGGPDQCPANSCGSTPPQPPTCPPGEILVDGVCKPKPQPPQPPSGDVPPKGQPTGGERLLRNQNNEFFRTNAGQRFDPFMAVPCCNGWEKVPNQLWPMASEQFMDESHKYGADMFHFRIGPWVARCDNGEDPGCGETEWFGIGGAYLDGTLDWNPKFWEKVRALAWHAYKMGAYVEVVPIDTWYIKHCKWGDGIVCSWPQADVDAAFNGVFTTEQGRLISKTVEELGCFGNVTWATGNEEDEVPAGGELYQKYVEAFRNAEKSLGCNFVHVIGTGSGREGIAADYSITHSKSAVTGPCKGRLCVNNEHNPEFTPEQEAANFKTAREVGQVYAAWRAGANDAAWEKRLKLFQDVVAGGGTGIGCFAPDGSDSSMWVDPPTDPSARPAQMMQAYNAAKAVVGDRCGATAPCTPDREPCAPPTFIGCMDTTDLIAAELRKQGYCASGSWGGGPELALLAPDGWWEQYHPCATENGCYTGNPYKFAWKYKGQNPTPGPTPPSGTCANPPAKPIHHFNVKEHTKGPNKTVLDSTPIVHDAAYCASIGYTDGRIDCPVRLEGDPLRPVCEAEVATPVWVEKPEGASLSPENAYQLWVPRGKTGLAKVCAQQNMSACGEVMVTP